MLETKNPSEEWPAEETEGLTLTVIKLNEQTLELEPALTVSLADASTATLAQLKAALEEKVMLTLLLDTIALLPPAHACTRSTRWCARRLESMATRSGCCGCAIPMWSSLREAPRARSSMTVS
jgi:hypothetical protein